MIVRENHPKAAVHLFGSTVSGLGFKGCDIDAYVDTWPVENNCKELKSLDRSIMQEIVGNLSQTLIQNPSITNVEAINKARVPIIKFELNGLDCDISFKNFMGVMNTKLIQKFIEYNPRILPFMIFIRYWASFYGLSGGGNQSRSTKISNYALTMLMINFLQVSFLPHL